MTSPASKARAHRGLGEACRVGRDPRGARSHREQALTLFTELGAPEAGQFRAQLAAAKDGGHRKQQTSQ